jgi:hypothetical protein
LKLSDPAVIVFSGVVFSIVGVLLGGVGAFRATRQQGQEQAELRKKSDEIAALYEKIATSQLELREKADNQAKVQYQLRQKSEEISALNREIANNQIDLRKMSEEWRRADSAKSVFVTKMEAAELLSRFPLGCQLFTMVQTPNGPHAVLTDSKTILPSDKAGKPGYLDFNWMQQGHVSVGDGMVIMTLPIIILEDKILPFFMNNILLRRATGVSLTMDINPNDSNTFMRGNDISSVSSETRLPLSKNPTLSVVVEIRAVIDDGVLMVLGLKSYANPLDRFKK